MATMRIQPLPGRGDQITCAIVFSPVQARPEAPVLQIERPGAKEGMLGQGGWAVSSDGMRPRSHELRGGELWLMFGPELSHQIRRNTPVVVTERVSGLTGQAHWPAIARNRQATLMPDEEERDWGSTAPAPAAPPAAVVPAAVPPPMPPVVQERPAAPALPIDDDATVIMVAPVPAPAPVAAPPPLPAPRRGGWVLWLVLAVLLAAAGFGVWWFLLREPPVTVLHSGGDGEVRPDPVPEPVPVPEPDPLPPGDPCLVVETVMSPGCRERLSTFPPEVQHRLALGLLARTDPPARRLALALLTTAASRGHGPSQMALARLYDPATFDRTASAANPARALDLYRDAAAANVPGAAEARGALIALLRRQAAGQGPEAEEARTVLRQAGIND